MSTLSELADEIQAWAKYWGQPLMLGAPIRLAERLLDRGYTKVQTGGEVTPEATPLAAGASSPRRFQLLRFIDVSGVTGPGVVVEGVQWTDGTVSVRWLGDYPSTVAWDNVDSVVAVHGHEGATVLNWLDGES